MPPPPTHTHIALSAIGIITFCESRINVFGIVCLTVNNVDKKKLWNTKSRLKLTIEVHVSDRQLTDLGNHDYRLLVKITLFHQKFIKKDSALEPIMANIEIYAPFNSLYSP